MEQKDLHPESQNLAHDLDDDTLQEIGEELCDRIQHDDDSRDEWKSSHAEWIRLYYQRDQPKNPPWEGSSTESVPMLAEACNQFHARAYKAMFPHRDVVKALPAGKVDAAAKERAERVGTHMSWQLLTRDRGYKRNKDRLLLSVPLHGSFFTKTYYNPVIKRNITENIRASDFIVPYGIGPRDLEDIDRKTQVLYYTMNKCRLLESVGYFAGLPEPYQFDLMSEPDEAHDQAQGFSEEAFEGSDLAKLYEVHTVWDLDGDGLDEPYIFVIDAISHTPLRVSVRYDTDEAGQPTNDKAPVEYFTHYPFLENPDGFYGLGQGHLISQLNLAANKLVRQTVDAGTLANTGNASGFVSNALGIPGGELEMQLGKFMKIPGSGDDIARGIFQFKFPGPSPTLLDVAALLMQRSDRLATVTEALTGQTDKVMQPTTVLALIEQGLEVFSTVYERILDSWGQELAKHYRLNHKYMDPEEYFSVLDVTGEIKSFTVARDDYAPDMQVIPAADPKNTSKQQKFTRAEAEYNIAMQNPLVMTSPIHMYNVTRRYFSAIETEAIDEILPNPAREVLPRADDPYVENSFLLMPEPMISLAYPDQDHLAHLEVHQELLMDPDYNHRLSDLAVAKLQEHIKLHAMMLYGQTEAGSGFGSSRAVVQGPGDAMGAQTGEGAVPGELAGGNGLAGGAEDQGATAGAGFPGEPEG